MKHIVYAGAGGALIGAIVVWYAFPRTKVEVRTETKVVTEYKTRIVEKWTKAPDGTETGERITDEIGTQASETRTEIAKQHNWFLGLSAGLQLHETTPIYGLHLERRILGPFFAGLYAKTNKEAGVSLGMEF